MSNLESKLHSARELIDTLKRARDRARVQAHLLTLEAKKRLHELDSNLTHLESRLEQGSESVATTVIEKLRESTETVKSVLRELDSTLELGATVRSQMKTPARACTAEDSLNRAAQLMWELDCGALPVIDREGKVIGMITDRDICMAAYTRDQPLSTLRVDSAMSYELFTCSPQDTLGQALWTMAEKQVRRLPVTENGKLVGMLALADLASVTSGQRGARTAACVALVETLAAISAQRKSGVREASQ